MGQERGCSSCRYWSELIAQADARGVQAYCLSGESERNQTFTASSDVCPAWVDGNAVDRPNYENDDLDDAARLLNWSGENAL